MTERVTVFVPFRNEIEGLKVIMPRLKPEWYDQLILLDGNSTDGSVEYLTSQGYKVVKQMSVGIKAAFWEGFDLATGDIIIPFSPDGNSIPEDIPRLIKKMKEDNDIVIASRYLNNEKSLDDNYESAVANYLITLLINIIFNSTYTDSLNMYKAFRKNDLFRLGIDKYKNEHSEVMLLTRGARMNMKISEISSPEPARIGPEGSRAHPGIFGKYKSGIGIIRTIIRDAFLYWPKSKNVHEDI